MIIAINKPVGITSHDVVGRVRRITKIKKVGHGGTLDPEAEGVLVIAIFREDTKKLTEIINHDKTYIAEVTLGVTSTTDDKEGTLTEITNHKLQKPNKIQILNVINEFIGEIEQVPPIYSAIKINGRKAYDYARSNQELVMEKRKVRIDAIKILKYEWPLLSIEVNCGKGVYIRSLARDIGAKLGVGGYMSALLRTRVGEFKLDKAMSLVEFEEYYRNLMVKV